eukprot:scaffold119406_cov18-Tisochrysis_lutea.AAC.1
MVEAKQSREKQVLALWATPPKHSLHFACIKAGFDFKFVMVPLMNGKVHQAGRMHPLVFHGRSTCLAQVTLSPPFSILTMCHMHVPLRLLSTMQVLPRMLSSSRFSGSHVQPMAIACRCLQGCFQNHAVPPRLLFKLTCLKLTFQAMAMPAGASEAAFNRVRDAVRIPMYGTC